MPLTLHPAHPSDCARISEIHLSAFSSNRMLHAQFPTPALRVQLRHAVADKMRRDIADRGRGRSAVLVVRDGGNGEVVGYARWGIPEIIRDEREREEEREGEGEREEYVEPEWRYPEGMEWGVLKEWTEKVEGAEGRIFGRSRGDGEGEGEGRCYHLSFLATDPLHQRRGAASLLINWGLQLSERDNIPAYLESTLEAAALYEKLGFRAVERITMVLPGEEVYEEIGFLYRPVGRE